MTRYKNSLLSIAAAAAISSTALIAANTGYIPLTTATVDYNWVLYGAAGFKSEGAVDSTPGEFSIPGTTGAEITENVLIDTDGTDVLGDSGLTVAAGDLGTLRLLQDLATTQLEVRVETTGFVYNETEPVRTMYLDVNQDGTADAVFTYKASLEGQKLEYKLDSNDAYELTIDYTKYYVSPEDGTAIDGTADVNGTEVGDLTGDNSIVDYDFSDNPPVSAQWIGAADRTAIGAGQFRTYEYDAADGKWDVYDTRNATGTNDFTSLTTGKGYWGRIATGADIDTTNTTNKVAGLVLSNTPEITASDYAAADLTVGWNLLAFDGDKPFIRNSATGMLVTLVAAAGDIEITDASGGHTLAVTLSGAGIAADEARLINTAVSNAKLAGTLPYTFEFRAYPTVQGAAGQIALISNQKFTIDESTTSLAAATTLAGQPLLNPTDLSDQTIVDIVGGVGAQSVYGEYVVVIDPVVGGTDAQSLALSTVEIVGTVDDAGTASTNNTINLGNALGTTLTAISANTALTGAVGLVTQMDLNVSGANDNLILASEYPFTIRDHTFTRVFVTAETGDAVDGSATIDAGVDVGPFATFGDAGTAAANATATAGAINGVGVGTCKAGTDSDKVVVICNAATDTKFDVYETIAKDNLRPSTSNADIALGAVKTVTSLEALSGATINNLVTLDPTLVNSFADNLADTYRFTFVDTLGNTINGDTVAAVAITAGDLTVDADNLAWYDELTATINTALTDNNMTASASHDYNLGNVPATEYADAVIIIQGEDIVSGTLDFVVDGGGNPEVDFTDATPVVGSILTSIAGDLAADLKYNNVNTPNYVMDGPLYTMRDQNMSLKALVTGTADLTDGTVEWDSIDLTRNPSEWLDSQEYNLFKVDARSGYWAYLEADSSDNPLTIDDANITGISYVHHFNGDGVTKNHLSGQINVSVTGIANTDNYESARVTATIGGATVELTGTDGKNFTGNFNTYEAEGISDNTSYNLIIDIADGLGNNLNQIVTGAFDNVKPQTPVITNNNGILSIDANETDTDVVGFYVYNDTVPEQSGEHTTELVAALTGSGSVGVICENLTQITWDSASDGLSVIALDGNGSRNYGNASDKESVTFMPILKERVRVVDFRNTETPDATVAGTSYGTNCEDLGPLTVDTGVSISAIATNTEVRLAYASLGAKEVTAVINTVYVSDAADDSGNTAKITYPDNYVDASVFVRLGGVVYGFKLPSTVNATATTSDAPADISNLAAIYPSTDTVDSEEKTDIDF